MKYFRTRMTVLTAAAAMLSASAVTAGQLGALHSYAPLSLWASSSSLLEQPAMEPAYQAMVDAAHKAGQTCHTVQSVKAAMQAMYHTDFAALAIDGDQNFTFYDDEGKIRKMCHYRYLGEENVPFGNFEVTWLKYQQTHCDVDRAYRAYEYVVATMVHQDDAEGMIHAHVRYGRDGFGDLMYDSAKASWWPTMMVHGADSAQKLNEDMTAEAEAFVGFLPPCQ